MEELKSISVSILVVFRVKNKDETDFSNRGGQLGSELKVLSRAIPNMNGFCR
jgi:hypothetical protein